MLTKKSSIITKFIIGISIIALFIMPISVSADNSVSLLDWGWAKTASSSTPYYIRVAGTNDIGNSDYVYTYFGINLKSGYTYTYNHTFVTTTYGANGIMLDGSNPLYYTTQLANVGTKAYFDGNTDKALISLKYNGKVTGGWSWTIKAVFNTDTSNMLATDTYFFVKINKNPNITSIGNESISCYYDPGGSGYQQEIVDTIAGMKNQDTEFYSNALEVLDNIKGGVDSANTKLDSMPQKIEDVLDKQATEEKTEANSTGNDVVNQATEALKNVIPYTSLLDAIQPIKQAASYTGTVSVWTLPSITIPKITGVMDETEIMSEKSFDLVSYADQFIPDTLLSVIRAVNTVGLILFAVYEVIRLVLWVVSSDSEGGGLFK